MHEISVMTQIVQVAIEVIKKNKVDRVKEIYLDVGDLTFLAPKQLEFAFEVISKDTPLSEAKLILNSIKPKLKCECGYTGSIKQEEDPEFHYFLPSYSCPKCSSKLKIVEGDECKLTKIIAES